MFNNDFVFKRKPNLDVIQVTVLLEYIDISHVCFVNIQVAYTWLHFRNNRKRTFKRIIGAYP